MVGVAVNVVLVPEQMVLEPEILTLAGRLAPTVIVMEFEVAGFPVAQVALEVSTQVITSLFASVVLV